MKQLLNAFFQEPDLPTKAVASQGVTLLGRLAACRHGFLKTLKKSRLPIKQTGTTVTNTSFQLYCHGNLRKIKEEDLREEKPLKACYKNAATSIDRSHIIHLSFPSPLTLKGAVDLDWRIGEPKGGGPGD